MNEYSPAEKAELRVRAKRELRKRMRAVRAALPARSIAERSEALVARVLAHPAWEAARTVALFLSLPDEVQTGALLRAARAQDKRVALPVVTDGPALLFREAVYAGDALVTEQGPMGVREPAASAPEVPYEQVDLVLVPALGLDARGHRLGYGRGYYDRTLPLLTRAVSVAVAFDFQLLAEVPDDDRDVAVQWVLTDRRLLRAQEPAP